MNHSRLYLQLISLISLLATMGSLYFSEIRQYLPCEMCWYQRIIMYPIVLISLIGIIRNDHGAVIYIRALSIIGVIVSGYHYSLQKFSLFGDGLASCEGVSCTVQYINWFGFITIPFLALAAFIVILILSFMVKRIKKENY